MTELWTKTDAGAWRAALDAYAGVLERQGVAALPELDRWYHQELGPAIAAREPRHVTHAELVRVTEWKMARGVWRARNLALVKSNAPDLVERLSADALAAMPHPAAPIARLAELTGVGPATASAVVAAAAPHDYPFFDELVAKQVPGLATVAFTHGFYGRYAQALRERAATLGSEWTPAMVERALWANVGGKRGVPKGN